MQPQLARVDGITLYMQPVQDLTVEDRVSRTQFQYTLEDANADELNTWTRQVRREAKTLPQLRDVPPINKHSAHKPARYRSRYSFTAGITPQAIDNALYDAFGQRQIATLFTQLNQYHLVLETLPDFQKDPAKLNDIYVKSRQRRRSAAKRIHAF